MAEHQVIINLSGEVLRSALDRADSEGISLSDLFERLLRADIPAVDELPPVTADIVSAQMPEFLETPEETRGQLGFLTNRLSPIKVAVKELAVLGGKGEWPALGDLQAHAATAARELGLRLRADDRRAGRRGSARRWTGYPVGDDADAARGRFVASFTGSLRDGSLQGPLAVLGLAGLTDQGRIALTLDGYELAGAISPLIDDGDHTLSPAEADVFRRRLRAARDEAAAISEFLGGLRQVGGMQADLDDLLATHHAEWSANRTSAERAAMLGRLGDLGMVRVEGRGSQARIELLDAMDLRGGGANGC